MNSRDVLCAEIYQTKLTHSSINDKLSDWLTDCLPGWLIDSDWLTDWFTDWPTHSLTVRLSVWLNDWLTEWLTVWLTSRLITIQTRSCLSIWQLTNRLAERLIVSLIDNEIDGNQINWLPAYMIDRLTGWLTYCPLFYRFLCLSVCSSICLAELPTYYLTFWQTK